MWSQSSFSTAACRLPPSEEEEQVPPHTRARRQHLLKIQSQCYGQNCFDCTDAGGIDPVVVVVMQVAEVEAMTTVLVCGLECIRCLRTSTTCTQVQSMLFFKAYLPDGDGYPLKKYLNKQIQEKPN